MTSPHVSRMRWLDWVTPALMVAFFLAFAITLSGAVLIGGFVVVVVWAMFTALLENRLTSGESAELELQRAHAHMHPPGDNTLLGEPLLLISGGWFGPYDISDRTGVPIGRMTSTKTRSASGDKVLTYEFIDTSGKTQVTAETRQGHLRAQLGSFELRVTGPNGCAPVTLRRRGISRSCNIETDAHVGDLSPNGWPFADSTIRDLARNTAARISLTSRGSGRSFVVEIEDHASPELRLAALVSCLALDAIAPPGGGRQ